MKLYTHYKDLIQAINIGETNCVTLVQQYLDNIDSNKHLNAFIEVFADECKERAILIDEKIKAGKAGKLAGMVIAIKDNIAYKGHQVTASSKILKGFTSIYSSTVIEKLLQEDAIIIGRCNCDEFAMGASNETSVYGPVLNAANNEYVPGGSSGGSAVAVQANLCHAAIGSDTGGSIRQPASFTGTVGLKPTYGRVSRWGLLAYASSFDQIGPITQSLDDAALILEVISGIDQHDATVSSKPVEQYSNITGQLEPKKIAYLKECFGEGVDPEIKESLLKLMNQLKDEGHQIEEVSFPYLDYLVPTYYILTTAEASSNLSRYQGLQYGHRTEEKGDLDQLFKLSRTEGFGKEVKRRIMLGTFVLTSDFYDAYYTKAQKVRRLIKTKTEEILNSYDYILTPTTPTSAFKFGEKSKDPVAMYLADIFTVQANISGHPAVSIPAGVHSNGLPFGVQILGRSFEEQSLLNFAKYIASKK
ncbi:MAG: Asp-tRNA(Asn)/Glu-tRNA(Gln) amidotransferase subunit GatA [Bacteroidetes bacterium]|nr:Asp-tRNA(Asn)/Glu-tRNA(Gln) amidotransferase subunit GatA [Bacteroidota bacterium]